MSRYEQREVGVFDNSTGLVVLPSTPQWDAYQQWLASGKSPDPPPFDADKNLRSRRKAYKLVLYALYADKEVFGVNVSGTRFKLDSSERQTLIGVLASVTAGNALPANFGWWDKTGAWTVLTLNNLKNLVEKMTQRDLDLRVRYAALLAAIDASPNPDNLTLPDGSANPDYVDLVTGWPT